MSELRCDACLQPITGDHYAERDVHGSEVALHWRCAVKRLQAEVEHWHGRCRSLTCDLDALVKRYPT